MAKLPPEVYNPSAKGQAFAYLSKYAARPFRCKKCGLVAAFIGADGICEGKCSVRRG